MLCYFNEDMFFSDLKGTLRPIRTHAPPHRAPPLRSLHDHEHEHEVKSSLVKSSHVWYDVTEELDQSSAVKYSKVGSSQLRAVGMRNSGGYCRVDGIE